MELLNGDVKLQRWKGGWFRIFTSLKYFRRQFFVGNILAGFVCYPLLTGGIEIEDILLEYLTEGF